jgi:hypothetical protein
MTPHPFFKALLVSFRAAVIGKTVRNWFWFLKELYEGRGELSKGIGKERMENGTRGGRRTPAIGQKSS